MADELVLETGGVPAPEPAPQPTAPPQECPPQPDAWRELGEVLWLSFPIVITMLSVTAMNFADALMVGNHSEVSLAAIGPAAGTAFLFLSLMMGTLSITNTFVAQSAARGKTRDAARYVPQAVYLGLAWGVVAAALWPLAPKIFEWARHPDHLRPLETAYFRWMLLRVPAVGIVSALAAFYQATKRPVVPMVIAIIANLVNVFLNWLFIFGRWGFPEKGLEGAAIATVIGSYLQAALILGVFLGPHAHRVYATRAAWRIEPPRLWRVLRYGLPAGLNWFLEGASWTLFLLLIVKKLGEEAMAAHNATMNLLQLSFMPVVGLNIGVQALVGHHIGRRDFEGARRRTYLALALGVGYMATVGLLFLFFRRNLIGWFVGHEPTADRVIALGSVMLVYAAVFQAFDAVGIVCYGALKGAGDTRFPMYVSLVCAWVVFFPLGYLLTERLGMGVHGAWLAITVFVVLVGGINLARFASGAWKRIDIFRDHTEPA